MMRLYTSVLALASVGSKVPGGVVAFQCRRQVARETTRLMASVSGTAYASDKPGAPTVRLFTKEGCTLCDKVKEVLVEIRDEHPHSLEQVDITDDGNADWFSKYKYDIPVLHIGDEYWIKHRIDKAEASLGLTQAAEGNFSPSDGEPDAGAMEKRQAERRQN